MDRAIIQLADAGYAGEILTLQRAAYVTEGQIYNTPFLPALTQSYDELVAELGEMVSFKATVRGRIVGAVRVSVRGPVAEVGRLIVAPDM